jgi:hypothetical protein
MVWPFIGKISTIGAWNIATVFLVISYFFLNISFLSFCARRNFPKT